MTFPSYVENLLNAKTEAALERANQRAVDYLSETLGIHPDGAQVMLNAYGRYLAALYKGGSDNGRKGSPSE